MKMCPDCGKRLHYEQYGHGCEVANCVCGVQVEHVETDDQSYSLHVSRIPKAPLDDEDYDNGDGTKGPVPDFIPPRGA